MAAKKTLFIYPGDPNSEQAIKACGRNNKSIEIVDISTLRRLPEQVDGVPILRVANRFFRGKEAIEACATFSKFQNRTSSLNTIDFADSVTDSSSATTDPPKKGILRQGERLVNKLVDPRKQVSFSKDPSGLRRFQSNNDFAPSKQCSSVEELINQRDAIYK